jgi:hypothetical protein
MSIIVIFLLLFNLIENQECIFGISSHSLLFSDKCSIDFEILEKEKKDRKVFRDDIIFYYYI